MPPVPPPPPAVRSTIVTLFGSILASDRPGAIVLDLASQLGDAPRLGLAGQIVLLERQVCEVSRGPAGAHDLVRLPEHVAAACAPQKKRK